MKAVVKLFGGIWGLLMNQQMFDLPFTFGMFLIGLAYLDVAFIILRHVLQNSGDGESDKADGWTKRNGSKSTKYMKG